MFFGHFLQLMNGMTALNYLHGLQQTQGFTVIFHQGHRQLVVGERLGPMRLSGTSRWPNVGQKKMGLNDTSLGRQSLCSLTRASNQARCQAIQRVGEASNRDQINWAVFAFEGRSVEQGLRQYGFPNHILRPIGEVVDEESQAWEW